MQDTSHHDPRPDDGIYLMDLVSGHSRLIVSIAHIVDIEHRSSMDGAHHWFKHLMFSPDDKRFIFLHRWISRYEGSRPTRVVDFRQHIMTHIAEIMRAVKRKTNTSSLSNAIFRVLHSSSRKCRAVVLPSKIGCLPRTWMAPLPTASRQMCLILTG